MTKPNDRISDELISAYLDGEVSAQERAQVERLLGSDPQYQQTLDELRTLRETLQSLPRYQLDADFHQRVLQIAQQQPGGQVGSSPVDATDSVVVRDVSPPRGFRRGLFWACMAMAAAILLMVYAPPMSRQAIGPVAQQPPEAAPTDGAITLDSMNSEHRSLRPQRQDERPLVREELVRGTNNQPIVQRPAPAVAGGVDRAGTDLRAKGTVTPSDTVDRYSESEEFRPDSARNWAASRGSTTAGKAPAMDVVADQPTPAAAEPMDLEMEPTAAPFGGITTNGLAADAVIHIRVMAREGSAEQLLTDNLKRNAIALVRKEPAETSEGFEMDGATQMARAPDSSLYFSNQAAVDYALVSTQPKQEAVHLVLVQAEAPQIVNVVNELQQEGVAVLATVPGPRQAQSGQFGLGRATTRSRQAGRGLAESGITATKEGLDSAERNLGLQSKWYESEEGETRDLDNPRYAITGQTFEGRENQLAVPTQPSTLPLEASQVRTPTAGRENVERMSELPEPRTPALQQQMSQSIADDETQGVQNDAARENDRDYDVNFWSARRSPPGDQPIPLGDSAYSFQALPANAAFARGEALQKQIDNLGTVAPGRPLQVLFVLHDDGLAFPAAEAVPTANESPAESAPSTPTEAMDPQSPN